MQSPIKSTLPLLLLLLVSISSLTLTSAASPANFIRSCCNNTAYPDICIRSLSTYALPISRNPRQLAHVALTDSALRAHQTSTYVSRLSSSSGGTPKLSARSARGSVAFRDCVTLMTHSADGLKQAAGELTRLGRAGNPQFALCMSNIQTWVSAALTDHSMCLDSLSQARAAEAAAAVAAIRKKVEEVRQVTSNALSLVNRITA